MKMVKKMDDVGRVVIPRDMRRALRWMDGDEIELTLNDDQSITLRKYEDDTAKRLTEMKAKWENDIDVDILFQELISLINSKTE